MPKLFSSTKFLRIKSDLKQVYDDLAPVWGKDIAKPDWGLDQLEKFVSLVKRGGGNKVLDLGCGSGSQSKQFSQTGLKVVGLDLSLEMIRQAKKRVPGAKFIVGDMTRMDFPKGSFDGVFAQASLLHIPKKLIPGVLGSIHRILRTNGILYLALKEGVGEKEVEEERIGMIIKRFFSFFTKVEIEDYLKNAKFQVLKVRRFLGKSPTIWLYVFARKNLKKKL